MGFQLEVKTLSETLNNNNLPESLIEFIHRPFDVTLSPLFRATLYQYSNNCSLLTFVLHHIITDLQSRNIFANELSLFYNLYLTNENIPELPEAGSYLEYVNQFSQWWQSNEGKTMLQDWLKVLPDTNQLLEIPLDKPRLTSISLKGERLYFELTENISAKINECMKQHDIDSYTLLLSSYAILLNKLSNQNKIIIGVNQPNRRNEATKNTMGCFENILPLEIDFIENPSGIEIIKQIKQGIQLLQNKQEVPFVELVNNSPIKMRTSNNAFFQTGFAMEPPMNLDFKGLTIQSLPFERKGTQLNLFVTLWKNNSIYSGYWEYCDELFEKSTMIKWIEIYKLVIESLTTNPELVAGNYNILTPEDVSSIDTWNNTDTPYENVKCIHNIFEEQVFKTPGNIALRFDGGKITYSDLNKKCNSLANHLILRGVKPGDVVAVCAERSVSMMVGILATLKAGAIYLPLNPEFQVERIQAILDHAQPKVILSTSKSAKNIERANQEIIYIDLLNLENNTNNLNLAIPSNNVAYIIYPSGSNEKPKGVMIEHHSVLNYIGWLQKEYPISDTDILIQKTSITFDISIWELFWWFFKGASLVLPKPETDIDPGTLIQYISQYKVSIIHFVPSMFNSFILKISTSKKVVDLSSLRSVFLSGEIVSEKLVTEFYNKTNSTIKLINLYGPSEATIDVSHYVCKTNSSLPVYIGKPINNTKLFIINKYLQLQPIGVPGELIISGVNLSRGYLNNTDLTNEKFILFNYNGSNIKAYRTGDLAKWTTSGNIEYIGRLDNQVKVRGFRIELSEIESMVLLNPEVTACAVVMNETDPNNKFLVGYYTVKDPMEAVSGNELKSFLMHKLPEYMVPSTFVLLAKMPLTNSGILDKHQLPNPVLTHVKSSKSEEINTMETKILKLWKRILKTDDIDITQNFFDVGGNSLLAIEFISSLKDEENITMNIMTIMQYPNIKSLSKLLIEESQN